MMFDAFPGMTPLVIVGCVTLAGLVGLINGELINRLRHAAADPDFRHAERAAGLHLHAD